MGIYELFVKPYMDFAFGLQSNTNYQFVKTKYCKDGISSAAANSMHAYWLLLAYSIIGIFCFDQLKIPSCLRAAIQIHVGSDE